VLDRIGGMLDPIETALDPIGARSV